METKSEASDPRDRAEHGSGPLERWNFGMLEVWSFGIDVKGKRFGMEAN
jgi:hypothetical protein